MKKLLYLIPFLFCAPLWAATYYVDYTNGVDSNNGTAKATPWKHAPGMNGVSGLANSTTINPGDSVILKGCVTFPNAAFVWDFPFAGTSGSLIYVGVDKTWWDNTVTGCSSAWNRPVFNLGNAAPNNDTAYRIIRLTESFVTFDNFEMMNIAALPSPTNQQTDAFDWDANEETNVIVEDMYIHDWVNPVFAVGTGNISASGTSVTNFVPYSYSPSVVTSWPSTYSGQVKLQTIPCCSIITAGSNTPVVSSITGTNPYTINFTSSPSNTGTGCTGCTVQIGIDAFKVFGGLEGVCSGCEALNNVIDGSDTAEVQLNPYTDCGASESNNQFCLASATAGWRQPNIWHGNVIRYIQSAFVGECTEWSGNLIEDIRLGTDPTGHTNAIECLDDTPSNNLFYNNVIRHANNPNASVPGGQWAIGLANQVSPRSGDTDYIFNNVGYDMLQNVIWGLYPSGTGCCGSVKVFNNTCDGGPSFSQNNDCINTCPSPYTACLLQNNHLVSNISSGSSSLNSCGSNCTATTNLLQTFSAANANVTTHFDQYTNLQTFAYSPTASTNSTVAAGTSIASICSTISAFNATAGAACLDDTTYGPTYNLTNHTAVPPARTVNTRNSTPNIGAFEQAGSPATGGQIFNGGTINGGKIQ